MVPNSGKIVQNRGKLCQGRRAAVPFRFAGAGQGHGFPHGPATFDRGSRLRIPDRRDLQDQRQGVSSTKLAHALLARNQPRRARRSPPRQQQIGAAGMDPRPGARTTDLLLPGNQPTPWRPPSLSLQSVYPRPKQPNGRSLGWIATPSRAAGGQSCDATNNTCKPSIKLSNSKQLRK